MLHNERIDMARQKLELTSLELTDMQAYPISNRLIVL